MDFLLPELGEGVYEAELLRWLVKPGDSVKRGQGLIEVMTDKATMEVPAPFAGTILGVIPSEGTKIKVGEPIFRYSTGEDKVDGVAAAPPKMEVASGPGPMKTAMEPAVSTLPGPASTAGVVAAPSIRHLARKLGIDLTTVRGRGPGGRILLEDITPLIAPSKGERAKVQDPGPKLDFGLPGTKIKLAGMRRKISEHLVEAKRRIPHYSYIDECEVTNLVRLRKSLRDVCAQNGLKLTYLAFFVKAVAAALKEVPIVNSSLDEEKQEIVLHERYNVGIAVATPTGLIVPVIQDVNAKDVFTVAQEIERLSNAGKTGKVKLEDLRGGTFTVTSIGNIGGLISTPIINHPEVGIMGIGQVIRRPVYDEDDRIRPADLVYLSYSFDHRVLDGAVGAAFGNAVKKQLENPAAMLVPTKLKS